MNVKATHANGVLVKIKSMVLFVRVKMVMRADFVKQKLMNVKDSSMINILCVANILN